MTRTEKRLLRLTAIPADFTWDELVAVLSDIGFVLVDGRGSHCVFISPQGKKIFLHRPHPGKIVKRYALRLVVESLKDYGIFTRG
jgi:predicted RNA binding protein YcfA (HicA-like mRNA interferase family)